MEFQSKGHNLLRTPHTVSYRRSWILLPGFALIQSKKEEEHNQFHHRTCNISIRGRLRAIFCGMFNIRSSCGCEFQSM